MTNNNTKIMYVLLGLIIGILGTCAVYTSRIRQANNPSPESAEVSTPSAVAHEGEHCGGNMTTALSCATGLHCAPAAGSHLPFGDVGGVCVKN